MTATPPWVCESKVNLPQPLSGSVSIPNNLQPSQTEVDFLRPRDRIHHHEVSWRRTILVALAVIILALLASTRVTVHNVAFAGEQHAQEDALLLAATPGVTSIAFSRDGKLLAGAYSDGSIRLWNPATGQAHDPPLRPAPAPRPARTRWRSARTASCWPAPTADGTIRLWNPATGQLHDPLLPGRPGCQTSADGVAFSPDGKLLAAAYSRRHHRLWNPATGQPHDPPLRRAATSANAVAFSPDGTLLAAAYTDGTIRPLEPGHRPRHGSRRSPPAAKRGTPSHSARTARSWPAPTPTAPSGSGTRAPASRPTPPCG